MIWWLLLCGVVVGFGWGVYVELLLERWTHK